MALGGQPLSVEDITATIEATMRFERYCTPEEREEPARRADALGDAGLRKAQAD